MEAKKTEWWPDGEDEYQVSVNLGARRPWEVYAPDEATALELIRRINTPSERLPDGVYRHADSLWLSGGFGVPDGWERIHDEAYRWPHPNASRVRPCSSPKVDKVNAWAAVEAGRREAKHGEPLVCIERDPETGVVRVWSGHCVDSLNGVEVDDALRVSVLAEDQP